MTLNTLVEEDFVVDLSGLASLQIDESLGCGTLGFKLANMTQDAIIGLDEGIVTLLTPINDNAWLGLHDIQFEVFLRDLDPDALV